MQTDVTVGCVAERRDELLALLRDLPESQLDQIEPILRALGDPPSYAANPTSDFATDGFAVLFGGILRNHHVVSHEPFTKDKFEHALEKVLNATDHEATRAPRGIAGRDLDVDGERWSLKTQADRSIKPTEIHISKFMELGRGVWVTEADLPGLRDRMFDHMERYDRIFTLRCLSQNPALASGDEYHYELVEIPKALLARAVDYPCRMRHDSRQTPKPGSCAVLEDDGLGLAFELYFDGGTERKLQVRRLAKRGCIVHASWTFKKPA